MDELTKILQINNIGIALITEIMTNLLILLPLIAITLRAIITYVINMAEESICL